MKILWAVKDMNTGKRVGVLKADLHSDTVYATAKHIFGRGVYIEAPKGNLHKDCNPEELMTKKPKEWVLCEKNKDTSFESEPWRRQDFQYACQHQDNDKISYIPLTFRPYPEEDGEHGGTIVYNF